MSAPHDVKGLGHLEALDLTPTEQRDRLYQTIKELRRQDDHELADVYQTLMNRIPTGPKKVLRTR